MLRKPAFLLLFLSILVLNISPKTNLDRSDAGSITYMLIVVSVLEKLATCMRVHQL